MKNTSNKNLKKPLPGIEGGTGTNFAGSSSSDDRQFYIDVVAKFCDKCGTQYNLNDVRIVKDSDFSAIIHLACNNCKSNHIATFVKPMGMTSRTPVNTDLDVSEISSFAKLDKVSTDEVLDLYNELEVHGTVDGV